ncbi:NAD(P)-dependent dehydrogenase (short-subunit alcohol dehydrogenase family) [Thermocatellispora tengchongensis]|uniref:NAD(P)-dependent dehydrogenase (Short-subunit alcohol dehydrogenase family) n=1 Tax=Thermocatellispora tengchongensis TaxID=1073253 RepID=A0A840PR17_9ACTN|nr:hypothetical protein [Thermocatellispora tengchongensis]MBB5138415.1 NAD(P)-dependent dehydrogenase (short-subunit alcohol dehydrogenase family) [Thermocatellispora tengchongensis]
MDLNLRDKVAPVFGAGGGLGGAIAGALLPGMRKRGRRRVIIRVDGGLIASV